METAFNITYAPLPGGGSKMTIENDQGARLELPLSRQQAMVTAAHILHAAGIGEARFAGTAMTVLSER